MLYKAELRSRQILENADVLDESDEDGFMISHQCPEDKVRQLFYQLTVDHKPVAADELNFLVESVNLPEVRQVIQEFLVGLTSPRCVQTKDCLRAIARTINALLGILMRDINNNTQDLHAVMVCAHNLFYFEGNRKQFLTCEIQQHRIWRNKDMWNQCIQKIINIKF